MLTKKDKKKRYNKTIASRRGHQFDGWGKQTADAFKSNAGGAIGGLASAATGAINAGITNAELQGVEEAQESIDKVQNFQSTADTNDDLLAEMAGAVNTKSDYNKKDFMQDGKTIAMNTINATLQGAAGGASAGPWGAVAGAAAGLIGGLAGWGAGAAKAKNKAIEMNEAAEKANLAQAQTLTAKAGALDQAADQRALAAYAAYGGGINTPKFPDFPSEITEFNTGGSHEENPYDGIPQGIAPDGLPNLVEEGEVKFDNYIFSDRLMLNKNDKKKYKFLKGKTYADAAKAIKKELGVDERPNDLIAKTDLEEHLNILSTLQEEERAKRGLRGENRMLYKNGGHIYSGKFDWPSLGQAMPAIGNAVGLIGNLFDKPKYEHTKKLTQSETPVTPVTYTPTHQDIRLDRFDTNYHANKLAAQAGATRRAIREQTASNPYASTAALLSADANAQGQMGDLYRKAAEYNQNIALQEAQFNSAGRRADAEGLLKAASTNAALQDKALTRQAEKDAVAARLNLTEDQAWDAANSANLTGLFDNLGAMGKEKKDMALATMKSLIEKGNLEEARKIAKQFGLVFKYGGKLKKKKGYTI